MRLNYSLFLQFYPAAYLKMRKVEMDPTIFWGAVHFNCLGAGKYLRFRIQSFETHDIVSWFYKAHVLWSCKAFNFDAPPGLNRYHTMSCTYTMRCSD